LQQHPINYDKQYLEREMIRKTFFGLLASATLLANVAYAEDSISAVHAFPETL